MRAAPTAGFARQPASTGRARMQRRVGHCACGGGCPRCGWSSPLKVGAPGDALEREAESVSDRLMRLAPTVVPDTTEPIAATQPVRGIGGADNRQRLALAEITPSARVATSSDAAAPASVHRALASPGLPLATDTRRFFESAFSHDFSAVRVHTDAAARQSAQDLHAQAYTLGHDVVLGAGAAATTSPADRRLLAHELTHVVQQHRGSSSTVMRSCSDENFCQPYDSQEEIDSSKWWLTNTYMRAEGVETYGTEVKGLYESFLSRSPGDSLDPVIFDSDSSYLVSAFKSSWDTKDDMDAVIEMVGNRLSRAPGWPMRDGDRWGMSLANFLSADEMANRPINYSNPLSIAGHIAGNIGSSDAGDDYRKITYGNVTLEKTVLMGNTGYVSVELTPRYEVFDAIDFCPGDCGSYAEQWVTIPMSRLEASGAAYDVPFKVRFTPETRSERFWF
ncbi:DUF4157 domain-containing protein [Pseudomonas sp. BN102]|uniref:eCIS core domain-containing protein n=1 Tax=Pseudomonas sp. BN102 TaxID=2567886 RepID=UPI0024577738|nr:DUF4157 domain-containing protein [Pseudomonas sp. BN102]